MLNKLKDDAKTVPLTIGYRLRNRDPTLTYEEYKEAVSNDWNNLYYVPYELRTEELCTLAVSNNGCALCWVPNELRTEELCKIAVSNTGDALYYVPYKLRTINYYHARRKITPEENQLTEALNAFGGAISLIFLLAVIIPMLFPAN